MSYGNMQILKKASLSAQNNIIGIIGPNGSGKSTLLKCIYRVLKADEGMILLDDTPLSKLSVKESAKKVAVVAQHNFYNFDFTIEEVVLMGRSPHKKNLERDNAEDYRIVDECIDQVGMGAFKGRSFSSLSGGEQQRIILARALAQQTECIVLDEPTNHLDIKYQLQLMDIVKKLKITVIAAFHDLNIAAMYCDYLYAMKSGEIAYEGRPEEVLIKETIQDLYEVTADIGKDRYGQIRITFYPGHLFAAKEGETR